MKYKLYPAKYSYYFHENTHAAKFAKISPYLLSLSVCVCVLHTFNALVPHLVPRKWRSIAVCVVDCSGFLQINCRAVILSTIWY